MLLDGVVDLMTWSRHGGGAMCRGIPVSDFPCVSWICVVVLENSRFLRFPLFLIQPFHFIKYPKLLHSINKVSIGNNMWLKTSILSSISPTMPYFPEMACSTLVRNVLLWCLRIVFSINMILETAMSKNSNRFAQQATKSGREWAHVFRRVK